MMMGICEQLFEYEKQMLTLLGLNYGGLEWCELGNQWTYFEGKPFRPAKDMYLFLGVDHTSIDINGLDGSVKLDLDKPVPSKFVDRFDIVTNYGTSEHVDNQQQVFRNVDSMCKVGGAMIHVLPFIGNWPDHCRYHYSYLFPYNLVKAGGYELHDVRFIDDGAYRYPRNLLAFTIRKTVEGGSGFTELNGVEDSGDTTFTGDYMSIPRRLSRKLKRVKGRLHLE
jgi:hypothetical protein